MYTRNGNPGTPVIENSSHVGCIIRIAIGSAGINADLGHVAPGLERVGSARTGRALWAAAADIVAVVRRIGIEVVARAAHIRKLARQQP